MSARGQSCERAQEELGSQRAPALGYTDPWSPALLPLLRLGRLPALPAPSLTLLSVGPGRLDKPNGKMEEKRAARWGPCATQKENLWQLISLEHTSFPQICSRQRWQEASPAFPASSAPAHPLQPPGLGWAPELQAGSSSGSIPAVSHTGQAIAAPIHPQAVLPRSPATPSARTRWSRPRALLPSLIKTLSAWSVRQGSEIGCEHRATKINPAP